MEKKKIIAVALIVALLVGLVVFASIHNITDTTILEINGTKYSKENFENYIKLYKVESDENDINISNVFDEYAEMKLMYQEAVAKSISLTEDEEKEIQDSYENDKEKLKASGINLENYTELKKEAALRGKLINDVDKYYELPDDFYNLYREAYNDLLINYNYRVMQITPETVVTKGTNEDGEEIDLGLTDEEIETKKAENLVNAKAKAEEALAKVNAGEDFEEVSKEYGTYRLVATLEGYNFVNGSLESMPLVYLESVINNEDLYKELTSEEFKPGMCTQIVEDDDSYKFIKLESIDEEVTKTTEDKFKKDLLSEYVSDIVRGNVRVIPNYTIVNSIKK